MTSSFEEFVRAVKEILAAALEPFRPVVRAGEVYSQQQAMKRLGVGQPVLKAWEKSGLPTVNRLNTDKIFYSSDDLIEFLRSQAKKG